MEIVHHVSFNAVSSPKLYDAIIELGIKPKVINILQKGGKLIVFDISENNPLWEKTFELLKKFKGFDIYHGGDIYETFFSEGEIRDAEWLRLIPTFEQGYPQPKGNWPFKQQSLISVCSSCAIYEQNNPMQIYNEPKLGKNSFMSLIALGEIFATPPVFSAFKTIDARGYKDWEVIIHKTQKSSEKIRQLYVPKIAQPGLIGTEEMRQVRCEKCGTIKYYSHKKGLMYIKRDSLFSDVDFVRTNEWFGVGLIAFRAVLVSNRVAKLILDKGWQGIRLKVVELT